MGTLCTGTTNRVLGRVEAGEGSAVDGDDMVQRGAKRMASLVFVCLWWCVNLAMAPQLMDEESDLRTHFLF